MNRLTGYVLSGCVLAGIGVSTACAHNDQSFFIRHVMKPPDDCLYKPDPTQTYIPEGFVDVSLARDYTPFFLVGNQLLQRADKDTVRAESSRINIEGAIVRVTTADGAVINEFTSLSSGVVDPQPGNGVTFAAAGLTILDPPTIDKLKGLFNNRSASRTIVSHVKAIGHTLGGTAVESDEFAFPITICAGCLVYFPAEANDNDPAQRQPNCLIRTKSGSSGQSPAATKVCQLGADQIVDCRDCPGYAACDPGNP